MVFFYPQTVEIRKSAVNGEIRVIKLFASYQLNVSSYTQSGGLVYTLWKKALLSIQHDLKKVNPRVLILGLGAGSNARIASAVFPAALLTGIEIDPVMIDLGKKYFSLDKIKNLKIVITDAISQVQKLKRKKQKFDLVLIDLYLGYNPAPQTQDPEFLQAVKALLDKKGYAVFNQLIIKNERRQQLKFLSVLKKVFPQVKRIRTPANLVYQASL